MSKVVSTVGPPSASTWQENFRVSGAEAEVGAESKHFQENSGDTSIVDTLRWLSAEGKGTNRRET